MPPGTEVEGIDGARFDLLEPTGSASLVAHGGGGGNGNKRFASSTRQAPRFAERGVEGESGWIELRLKLLADAGLVGLPNAGKSSLLARLTAARPRSPTTRSRRSSPCSARSRLDDRQLVLADIPGLIEGAAEGAGLGHEFLAHVERCGLIVHVVDIAPTGRRPRHYATVREELGAYGAGLASCPSSSPSRSPTSCPTSARPSPSRGGASASATRARRRRRLVGDRGRARGAAASDPRRCPKRRLARPRPEAGGGFEAEHRVYTPAGTTASTSSASATALPRRGPRHRAARRRHDLANAEALDYLEQRLREIGVVTELRAQGFEPGDEVRSASVEFELDPVLTLVDEGHLASSTSSRL